MHNVPVTDERLIAAIRENDYVSYNKLFERYYARLCQYVYGILQDKADSEDVVQELFLNLWNHRRKIVVKENVAGYLFRMAKNLALNHIRSTTNYQTLLDNQRRPSDYYEETPLESDEFRIALFDCINRLPHHAKQVLLLHRVEGLKQKEIAERLNITVKTVKNQIWVSLQKLRRCLEVKGVES